MHFLLNTTRLGCPDILSQQLPRRARSAHTPRHIHGTLQRIILPPKDVVGVLPKPGIVAVAEVKGLRAVLGPLALVVELRRVPDDFEHELRDVHWVGGGALGGLADEVDGARGWVGYVVFVVGCVLEELYVSGSRIYMWKAVYFKEGGRCEM